MTRKPAVFSDCNEEPVLIASTWASNKTSCDADCQTSAELFQEVEREVQTGRYLLTIQDEVGSRTNKESLVSHYVTMHGEKHTSEQWSEIIRAGFITVDYDVCTNPNKVVNEGDFIEYVNQVNHVSTQTGEEAEDNKDDGVSSAAKASGFFESKHADGKEEDEDEYNFDFDEDEEKESAEAKSSAPSSSSRKCSEKSVEDFLRSSEALMSKQLKINAESKAFQDYDSFVDTSQGHEVNLWKSLTVDLAKKKILFPDWAAGSFHAGVVTACRLTRVKERIYTVEFHDGTSVSGIREEYMRATGELERDSQQRVPRIIEGMRVFARTNSSSSGGGDRGTRGSRIKSSSGPRWVPGRIVSVSRAGMYDVELPGRKVEKGKSADEVVVGLKEGWPVEARKPVTRRLHATSVSWNCTGKSLAVCYGRTDMNGWCDMPGAVCVWRIFSKDFAPENPYLTFDHASCFCSLAFHPENPALLAAGSFDGQLMVWDISQDSPEEPVAMTPINEFCHSEPVFSLCWIWDAKEREFLLISAAADGRILTWSLSNKLRHPVRGAMLNNPAALSRTSERRVVYPIAYPACALSYSGGSHANSALSRRPQWAVLGQLGGKLVRVPASKLLVDGKPRLAKQDFKIGFGTKIFDIYTPLLGGAGRGDSSEASKHKQHIGPVHDIDFSPFHRALFLTAGDDGCLRLYHSLRQEPLLEWEPEPPNGRPWAGLPFDPVTAVKFSPVRPCVFAAATESGQVHIFDLVCADNMPVVTLEPQAASPDADMTSHGRGERDGFANSAEAGKADHKGSNLQGITCLSFNGKQRNLLAVSDRAGRAVIWRLSAGLCSAAKGETAQLEQIAKKAEE
jgi:WD40 repeat protein